MNRGEMKVIGGSTIAAILGLSKWQSPHSVWLQLTGQLTGDKTNETLERGKVLERVIAGMYGANHMEYELQETEPVFDPKHEYLIASPDRMLIGVVSRELGGLEIKTADITTLGEWGEEDTEEIPVQYLCQCQWYAGFFDVPDWKLAVGFVKSGTRKVIQYREYCVGNIKARYEAMVEKAVEFWEKHVVANVPPEITEADPETIRYYKSRYPSHESGKWIAPTTEIELLALQLVEAKATLDIADKRHDVLKTKLIAILGDAEGVNTSSGKITYKQTKPSLKTDWKQVAEALDAPQEIINQYTSEQPGSRRFLITKNKEK